MSLIIVAQIRAADGKAEALEEALRALIPLTVAEDGCETYALHRSIEDPALFHFHEVWRDAAAWQAHMDAPHLRAFSERTDELVADWTLFQLERIA